MRKRHTDELVVAHRICIILCILTFNLHLIVCDFSDEIMNFTSTFFSFVWFEKDDDDDDGEEENSFGFLLILFRYKLSSIRLVACIVAAKNVFRSIEKRFGFVPLSYRLNEKAMQYNNVFEHYIFNVPLRAVLFFAVPLLSLCLYH